MELVLTILVVTLLVILPALFLVLVVGGLIYALYKALVGTKEKGASPSAPGQAARQTSTTKLPSEDLVAHNANPK
jgi:threonine/homoserine/homoserine lactone efflux protein